MSDWDGERLRDDKRWKFGVPLMNNANFTWIRFDGRTSAP